LGRNDLFPRPSSGFGEQQAEQARGWQLQDGPPRRQRAAVGGGASRAGLGQRIHGRAITGSTECGLRCAVAASPAGRSAAAALPCRNEHPRRPSSLAPRAVAAPTIGTSPTCYRSSRRSAARSGCLHHRSQWRAAAHRSLTAVAPATGSNSPRPRVPLLLSTTSSSPPLMSTGSSSPVRLELNRVRGRKGEREIARERVDYWENKDREGNFSGPRKPHTESQKQRIQRLVIGGVALAILHGEA
jgi:hypothetical protein